MRLLTIAEVITQFEDMRNNGSLSVENRTALNRAYWILKDVEADEMLDKAGLRLVWQRTGEWIYCEATYDSSEGYECSNCKCSFHTRVPYFSEFNFCPNCGADMRKEEEE